MQRQALPSQRSAALDEHGPRAAWVALAVLLGIQCLVAAHVTIVRQAPFSEYLGQARRCVELHDCPSQGGRTGALPLFHGASWIRLLSYALRSGADLTLVQSIIFASWVASLPIAFFLLYRYLGPRAAALGVGLYFPVILVGTDIVFLTYTNLLPLPFALYYLGMALFIERQGSTWVAVASAALAAAVSAELGGIVMVPFHFLAVGLIAPRALRALVVAALAFAIPFCLDSMDAALAIARQVPTLRFALALAICGGAVAMFLPSGRRLLASESLGVGDRIHVFMTAALVYATATVWLGNLFLSNGVPAPRYFLPASFPFLYLLSARTRGLGARGVLALAVLESLTLGFLLHAPRGVEFLQLAVAAVVTLYAGGVVVRFLLRRPAAVGSAWSLWPAVAICLCAVAIAAGELVLDARRGGAQTLTMATAEKLIPALYGAGYTYPRLLTTLQGPAVDDMVSLLTERDPDLFREPTPRLEDPTDSLLVLNVPDDMLQRTSDILASVPAGDGRAVVIVRGARSYLDWGRMRRCTRAVGESAYACAEPARDQPLPHNWPYVRFGSPVRRPATDASAAAAGASVRYEVPVHTPGHGSPHIVRMANEWPASWRIVGVSGVAAEGELPGAQVRLLDTERADGELVLELSSPLPTDRPWVWMPHVVEVEQRDAYLLEALDGRR